MAAGWRGSIVGIVVLMLGAKPSLGGQPTYDLEVRGQGFKRISIQMPEPSIDAGATSHRGDVNEAQETLARDLIYSGFFYVMDSYASPYLPRGVSRAWNVSDERPSERPHRVEATWHEEGSTLVADLRLVDAAGNQLVGKRYQIGDAGPRAAVHHFADQVVRQLTGLPGNAQTKIAYARMGGKTSEICTVDYDGFGERDLTAQQTLSLSPCWGTGRAWVAFTSYAEGQPFLYRLDQGTRRLRPISRSPGLNTSPEWSAARKAFALTLTRDGNAEIYSMDENGAGARRLTHHPAIDTSPTWSPNGQQVAFTSDRSGVPQIYVMDADGGNVRRLTDRLGYDGGPFFSWDGRFIVYRAGYPDTAAERDEYLELLRRSLVRPRKLEIFAMKADGTGVRQVTRNGAANFAPFMHPNGQQIIFSSNLHDPSGRSFALYVINVDGSGLERVTWTDPFASFPMFTRDGTKLVFSSSRQANAPRDINVFVADWAP